MPGGAVYSDRVGSLWAVLTLSAVVIRLAVRMPSGSQKSAVFRAANVQKKYTKTPKKCMVKLHNKIIVSACRTTSQRFASVGFIPCGL